jgi:effector-binding domain-containing protein
MKPKLIIITPSIVLLVLLIVVMIGPIMSNVEHPTYKILSAEKNIEIRQYNPMIIAEIKVQGDRDKAIKEGFRALADYIFGNNTSRLEIAMTAPVQQQANEKISMTAPVQQQALDGAWSVSFVMPSQYTIDTLPKPNNANVNIKKVPEQKFAAIKFTGISSKKNIGLHEKSLLQFVKLNQMKVSGPAKYAFYNPPWTLPFMRRNEVMFLIE